MVLTEACEHMSQDQGNPKNDQCSLFSGTTISMRGAPGMSAGRQSLFALTGHRDPWSHRDMQTIREVLAAAGGAPALAAALGIHRTAVIRWRRVPARRVVEVARITGIPAHQLRPDLAEIFATANNVPANGALK